VYQKQDLVGKGDPFVVVKIGEKEKRTVTVKNTQNPVWQEGLYL
jgi:Ca2+-dependent lipid-binding protein